MPNIENLSFGEATVFEPAGKRFDAGKPRVDLLPPEFCLAYGHLAMVGADIHGDRNWEKGMKWGKMVGSILRHTFKFMCGERYDKKTGAHHMTCAAWNAIGLFVYDIRQIGEDDVTARKDMIESDAAQGPVWWLFTTTINGNRYSSGPFTTIDGYMVEMEE